MRSYHSQRIIYRDNPLSQSMNTKSYLVNKITQAMKMKYDDAFKQINYRDDQLKRDIDNLITTQYYSWNAKDLFKPIEQDVISLIKRKNPNAEIKVKKARYIKRPIPIMDKYQEADLDEEMKHQKYLEDLQLRKEKRLKELSERRNKKKLNNRSYTNSNIKTNKNISSLNNEITSLKYKVSKKKEPIKILETDINNLTENNNNNDDTLKEELNLIEELGKPSHSLVDKYNQKIKYDTHKFIIEEEKLKYEEEQRRLKEKQKEELDDIKVFLKIQMLEKQNQKRLEEILEKKYLDYQKEDY